MPGPLAGLDIPRITLGEGPTPVRELWPAGEQGRAAIWIKQDGLYGDHGGNKARKLEWLLAEALRRRSNAVITAGALGTNHGLATALYAEELGLRSILILVPQPENDHVRAQLARIRATPAKIHLASNPPFAVAAAARSIIGETIRTGRRPYLIPAGGSSPLGTIGYVIAGLELGQQVADGTLPEPSHVVVALGSGGTAAGILLGMRLAGLGSRLTGILVNDLTPVNARRTARLANRASRLLRRHGACFEPPELSASDLDVHEQWLGDGYGHSTSEGVEAGAIFESEGVMLEPVYTAKAAAGLLSLNGAGAFGSGSVLFWNTHRPPHR